MNMRTLMKSWPLGLLTLVAACGITDVDVAPPAIDDGVPLVETLDAPGLASFVAGTEAEFDLVLLDDGLTAEEVEVRSEDLSDDERIQSRIVSVDEAGEGRLDLLLGGLEVSFSPETRFWIGDDRVSRAAFVSQVHGELSEGRQAPVIAERDTPTTSPDPQDKRFVARDVTLGGDGTPSLRMRVRRGNLETVASPSGADPDQWLSVLGHRVRLRMRDGTTKARCYRRITTFDGEIASVDVKARSVAFVDGLSVRFARFTHFVRGEDHVRSLRAVEEALNEGNRVYARGVGAVEHRNGRVLAFLVAVRVEQVEPEPEPVMADFEGAVASLRQTFNAEGGMTLVLANGTEVRVHAGTEIVAADDVSPASLAELADALTAGREVIARGSGQVMGDDPLVLKGVRIVLQGEAPGEVLDDFSGRVDFVSDGGAVILIDGTAVDVSNAQVVAANEDSPATIAELMAMLDMGRRVDVSGAGTFRGPQDVVAVRLTLTAQVQAFDFDVATIDPGGLILDNGSFVLIGASTVITAVGDGPTDLGGVDAALFAGDRVRARGIGYVIGGDPEAGEPLSFEALTVEFERIPQG
jgi:hypothetical protein